jgi:FixJ family two-component response regulator
MFKMIAKSLLEPLMTFLQRRFILIADDNRDLAISSSILLKIVGFEVETVHNGRDALTAATNHRPDVLLAPVDDHGGSGSNRSRFTAPKLLHKGVWSLSDKLDLSGCV